MMRAFARLFDAIDSTTSTNLKVAAMTAYLATAEPADASWAVYFLSGRKLQRLLGSKQMQGWLASVAGLPHWLVEETYAQVGDLAETIALLADSHDVSSRDPTERAATPDGPSARSIEPVDASLHAWIERLLALKTLDSNEQQARVERWWRQLPYLECLVVNKLLTGAFRIGVSQTLLTRALAAHMNLPIATVTHRLMGRWDPTPAFWSSLRSPDGGEEHVSRPYPFFLASPLEHTTSTLGAVSDWQAEWKWDGIRAQIVRRRGAFISGRGARISLWTNSRSWPPRAIDCPRIWCWMARSWPGTMGGSSRSRLCRPVLAARSSRGSSWIACQFAM